MWGCKMSLIICPECGKEISDRAKQCVHCGFPIEEYLESEEPQAIVPNEIKCPFCGSERIDNDGYCDECGMLISSHEDISTKEIEEITDEPHTICPKCGNHNRTGVFKCVRCRHKYKMEEYNIIFPQTDIRDFKGIYKYTAFGYKQEVYCPRCGSENCSYYQEQKIIPGKTKTRYTANLNPLHPFTFANKKEKVIREERIVTESKIVCNSCGEIFR